MVVGLTLSGLKRAEVFFFCHKLSSGVRCLDIWLALLTKLVRTGWLDIGQVLFCFFIDRDIKTQKTTRPLSSHLDQTSLVNKGFITWPKIELFLT